MFPGTVTKLSENPLTASGNAIAAPVGDVLRLTGNTAIQTIPPPQNGGFSSLLYVIPTTAACATITGGNIAVAVTMPQNKVTVMIYSKTAGLWYPNISA